MNPEQAHARMAAARLCTRLSKRRWLVLGAWLCAAAGPALCASEDGPAALPAVVVWDFDNQSAVPSVPGDRIDYLRRSLSENLTSALLQVPGLPVVERQRLSDLLAEQKLGSAVLADDDTRLRLGKIVGAERMVFGGFFVIGGQVQVNVRVVDTATSRVVFSDETTSPLASVMQDMRALDTRLVRALGGAGTGGKDFPAEVWQRYDRALAMADAGQLDAAVQALQALLGTHADFDPAARELVALLDRLARR